MTRRALLVLLLLAALPVRPSVAQQPPAFVVVAHPGVKVRSISKGDLAAIYLKKATSWPGGGTVVPFDLAVSSATREAFSRRVHGKGAKAVKNWWTQQIYAGKGTPPPELASDAKMLDKVLATPGAVGYVSGTTVTGNAVVLTVTD